MVAATVLPLGLGLTAAIGPAAGSPSTVSASSGLAAGASTSEAQRRGNPDAYRIQRLGGGDGPRVGWRHCRRINYRVNYAHAPNRSRWHVKEAVRRLKRATGMHFRYAGRTTVRPSPRGDNYPRRTKLVIGWASAKSKYLGERQVGVGGSAARSDGSIVSSFVLINYRIKMAPGFGRGPRTGIQGTRGQVLMHELGHTVGLAHVQAKAQIMYPVATRKKATWGAGDWRGLRKQGRRAGCF
jgi:hypothetical protein